MISETAGGHWHGTSREHHISGISHSFLYLNSLLTKFVLSINIVINEYFKKYLFITIFFYNEKEVLCGNEKYKNK